MGFKQDRGGVISRGWSIFRQTSRKEAQLSRGSPGGRAEGHGVALGGQLPGEAAVPTAIQTHVADSNSEIRKAPNPRISSRRPRHRHVTQSEAPGGRTWPGRSARGLPRGESVPGFCGLDRGAPPQPPPGGPHNRWYSHPVTFPCRGALPSVRGPGSAQLQVRPCHSLPAAVVTGGTQSPSEGWRCVTARSPAREAVLRWTTLQPLRVWG